MAQQSPNDGTSAPKDQGKSTGRDAKLDATHYVKFQFIPWEVPTEFFLPAPNGELPRALQDLGRGLTAELRNRLALLLDVVETAFERVADQTEKTTLKVFMVPEFYFRQGDKDAEASGAFTSAELAQTRRILEAFISAGRFTGWVFVFGTFLWKTSLEEMRAAHQIQFNTGAESYALTKDRPIVFNTALVGYRGKVISFDKRNPAKSDPVSLEHQASVSRRGFSQKSVTSNNNNNNNNNNDADDEVSEDEDFYSDDDAADKAKGTSIIKKTVTFVEPTTPAKSSKLTPLEKGRSHLALLDDGNMDRLCDFIEASNAAAERSYFTPIDTRVVGVEVCNDHASCVLTTAEQRRTRAALAPELVLHLLIAAGMEVLPSAVAVKRGRFILRLDGYASLIKDFAHPSIHSEIQCCYGMDGLKPVVTAKGGKQDGYWTAFNKRREIPLGDLVFNTRGIKVSARAGAQVNNNNANDVGASTQPLSTAYPQRLVLYDPLPIEETQLPDAPSVNGPGSLRGQDSQKNLAAFFKKKSSANILPPNASDPGK